MVFLKEANREDAVKEWQMVRDMPEDENGLTNPWHGVDWPEFSGKALPEMMAWARGEGLPPGYVPETFLFLWDGEEIVGQFRIRHALTDSLREGAGHIGYAIARPFRGKGYGKEGLRQTLLAARELVGEEEIFLRVRKDNPASLHVMLHNGGRIAGEKEDAFLVRIANPGKGRYPERREAERLLEEGERRNPGPWGNHSRTAAHCAEAIAKHAGLCPDKAYVLGLLHDIGRREGGRQLGHVADGYAYMMSLGYPDCARICLTHSFNDLRMEAYAGRFDTTEEETRLIRDRLRETVMDDYDRLIQLCDAISGPEGVMDIIDRMSDVRRRYGTYDPANWDRNLELKAEFEKRMGMDLYTATEKDTFRLCGAAPREGD